MKLAVLVVTVIRTSSIVDKLALAVEAATLQLAIITITVRELDFPAPTYFTSLKHTHEFVSFLRL